MAAYLNRTISLVTGNGTGAATAGGSFDAANALTDRQLHNAATDNSPLQIFVKAKKRVNDIFGEIEEYVLETHRFIDGSFWFFVVSSVLRILSPHLHLQVTPPMPSRLSTKRRQPNSRATCTRWPASERCWRATT